MCGNTFSDTPNKNLFLKNWKRFKTWIMVDFLQEVFRQLGKYYIELDMETSSGKSDIYECTNSWQGLFLGKNACHNLSWLTESNNFMLQLWFAILVNHPSKIICGIFYIPWNQWAIIGRYRELNNSSISLKVITMSVVYQQIPSCTSNRMNHLSLTYPDIFWLIYIEK